VYRITQLAKDESVVDRESVMSQLGEHEQVYRITQLAKGESMVVSVKVNKIYYFLVQTG
jgi:hypothetical protein